MLVFEAEPAFVIHKRPYRDHSSLVQFLTPGHGRITVVARLSSKLIGKTLQPFIPARLTCSGRGSLLNMRHFEPEGVGLLDDTRRRMVGIYVNELVVKLTPSASPSRQLFELYRECLQALAAAPGGPEGELERALRHFELRLLELTGNGLQLEHEHDTLEPVAAGRDYYYHPGRGPERTAAAAASGRAVYRGATLIALRGGPEQWGREILPESKRLLRSVIDYHLHGSLQARQIFDYLKHLA